MHFLKLRARATCCKNSHWSSYLCNHRSPNVSNHTSLTKPSEGSGWSLSSEVMPATLFNLDLLSITFIERHIDTWEYKTTNNEHIKAERAMCPQTGAFQKLLQRWYSDSMKTVTQGKKYLEECSVNKTNPWWPHPTLLHIIVTSAVQQTSHVEN